MCDFVGCEQDFLAVGGLPFDMVMQRCPILGPLLVVGGDVANVLHLPVITLEVRGRPANREHLDRLPFFGGLSAAVATSWAASRKLDYCIPRIFNLGRLAPPMSR